MRKPMKTSNKLLIIGAAVLIALIVIANFVAKNYLSSL